jgi:hypothetical protein
MLPFLGRCCGSSHQGKHGHCKQTNHREDYARLNEIANRNLLRREASKQFGFGLSRRAFDGLCAFRFVPGGAARLLFSKHHAQVDCFKLQAELTGLASGNTKP